MSLFNHNLRKIYYVPSSNLNDDTEEFKKHFFLDAKEAKRAMDKSKRAAFVDPALFPALPTKTLPPLIPTVYAANSTATQRNYTLRLREVKVSGIDTAAQVYLDIPVDGQSIRPASLPGANASELRDLTVFADTPVRFDSLYRGTSAHRCSFSRQM